MREEKDPVMPEVVALLEAEPVASTHGVLTAVTPGPVIPALREQLVILISTGKAKKAGGQ